MTILRHGSAQASCRGSLTQQTRAKTPVLVDIQAHASCTHHIHCSSLQIIDGAGRISRCRNLLTVRRTAKTLLATIQGARRVPGLIILRVRSTKQKAPTSFPTLPPCYRPKNCPLAASSSGSGVTARWELSSFTAPKHPSTDKNADTVLWPQAPCPVIQLRRAVKCN